MSMTKSGRIVAVMAALALGVAALSACSGTGSAPPATASPTVTALSASQSQALQAVLNDARSALGFPGVIARVITPEGEWTGSAGATAAGGTTKPGSGDHTRIGSLTKTMTATILLQLVGEGKVSLDDPISKYVPDLPNPDATLRQVADMTSGIPSYTLDQQVTDRYLTSPQDPWTPAQLLDAVRTLPPSFAPGQGWQYSNSNYVALGQFIEKVTGQPLAEVFQKRIFTPLGMTQSSYPSGTDLPAPYLAGATLQGATGNTPRDATHFNPTFAASAGQVVSTLDDMTKWAHALATGDKVLTPAMQQVRRDSILTSPPPNSATAGYGIGIGNRNGWWGHDGDIPGYTTSVYHSYDHDATLVVLVNSDIGDAKTGAAPAPAVFAGLVKALGW
ncbi:serine hydrolase domain-containing protein [Microbacterium panaciterrae]|uniref:Serine hydrolase domain-containing protein n=1 Tax=Microbacterium panaciterrae TaxID=985759 RepID=A0ABP8P512_9MICO